MIITQTPLRVSLGGGGTDLAAYYERREGYVISTAIDKLAYVIVKERFDDEIYLNYMRKEICSDVDSIRHELIREAMHMTGVDRGVEVTLLSDVPSQGSGLGSSSSFTVGLLNAFYAFWAGLFVMGLKMHFLNAYPFTREFKGAVMESFAGALIGILVVLALLGWLQCLSRRSLPIFSVQIAVRVLGSWIAATGLLVLALEWRAGT